MVVDVGPGSVERDAGGWRFAVFVRPAEVIWVAGAERTWRRR